MVAEAVPSRHDPVMFRPFRSFDLAVVQDLVAAAGMFTAEEVGFLEEELPSVDPGSTRRGDAEPRCVVSTAGDEVVGVVYYRPEEAAEGVWDLTMIAVDPAHQGAGIGHELLRHVEVTLAAQGARLLAVRTSGTTHYDGARVFYERAKYDRAATVGDWWTDGDDLVLYVKRL